jgi:hypothetical protein
VRRVACSTGREGGREGGREEGREGVHLSMLSVGSTSFFPLAAPSHLFSFLPPHPSSSLPIPP